MKPPQHWLQKHDFIGGPYDRTERFVPIIAEIQEDAHASGFWSGVIVSAVALALAGLVLLCGCTLYPVVHGIPNFAVVEPGTNGAAGMYRGGEPTPEGWQVLRAMDVTNIVQLDYGHSAPPWAHVMRHPIGLWDQYLGNPGPKLEAAYADLEANPQQVFWHCARGKNRSGALGILWRVRHDHWTKADAIWEANGYGWKSTGWALKRYVRDN